MSDRLISADVLKSSILQWQFKIGQDGIWYVLGLIDSTPTVEAEPIKQGRWIPCSERLPEYITSVLVQLTRTGDIFIGALVPNVDGTYTMWDLPNFSSYICLEDVIAWMPLPEPYKVDEVEISR